MTDPRDRDTMPELPEDDFPMHPDEEPKTGRKHAVLKEQLTMPESAPHFAKVLFKQQEQHYALFQEGLIEIERIAKEAQKKNREDIHDVRNKVQVLSTEVDILKKKVASLERQLRVIKGEPEPEPTNDAAEGPPREETPGL